MRLTTKDGQRPGPGEEGSGRKAVAGPLAQGTRVLEGQKGELANPIQRETAEAASQVEVLQSEIAERQRTEAALRESERRFREMMSRIKLISLMLDRHGRITYCNDYLLALTGWRREEVFGQDWFDLFIPPALTDLRTFFEDLLNDHPDTWHHENEILTKSGERRLIRWNNSLLRSVSGEVIGTASVGEDITERKRAELEIQRSRSQLRALLARFQQLREEERTRIARDVHDVLGQMLTGLKMDLSWCERRFTKIADERLRRALQGKIEATARLADTMIETVQKISRELRPSLLDNIGLGAALQFEARQFQERTGILCEVSVPVEPSHLERDMATGVFRVFQELITNVARHARANRVAVSLRQTGEGVALEVCDDGRGIHDAEVADPKSLGLLGMSERASLMGGSLHITRGPGGGTVAILTIPMKAE
jgi:PAS domain S-box-containing protein